MKKKKRLGTKKNYQKKLVRNYKISQTEKKEMRQKATKKKIKD